MERKARTVFDTLRIPDAGEAAKYTAIARRSVGQSRH
jgi:hypothetical protein